MVRGAIPNELVSMTHSRKPSAVGATLIMEREISEVEGMTCNSWYAASSMTVTLLPRMVVSSAAICGECPSSCWVTAETRARRTPRE